MMLLIVNATMQKLTWCMKAVSVRGLFYMANVLLMLVIGELFTQIFRLL